MPKVNGDCATEVEGEKLLFATDYLQLVSGGEQSAGFYPTTPSLEGLGDTTPYYAWPPAPKPKPEEWNGWKLVQVDGKWLYRDPKNPRLFITASNLYDMMGIPKNPQTGFVPAKNLPKEGIMEKLGLAGVNPAWLVLGGIGAYVLMNRKGR